VEDFIMKQLVMLITTLTFVVTLAGLSSSANGLNGTYISKDNKNEYITFSPDGKFFLKQQKKPYDIDHPYVTVEGTYKVDGDLVTLRLPDGGEAVGKIQGNTFVDNQRGVWLKDGAVQKVDPNSIFKKRSY
jgi:hypothetical protein